MHVSFSIIVNDLSLLLCAESICGIEWALWPIVVTVVTVVIVYLHSWWAWRATGNYVLVILKFICIYDCEVHLHLWCGPYIYMNCLWCLLWTICDGCDVYLNVVHGCDRTKKLIICGSFAECYTRQKSYLPSTMKNTLDKADTWLKWLLCRVSALWHSAKKACLLSVSAWTLGKETKSWV